MKQRASYSEGFAFAALSFAFVGLIGIASTVATARVYGVQSIGRFALAYAPTGIVWFLSNVREQAALVRELSSQEPRAPRVTGLFAAVFAFSSGLTFVVSAIAAAVSWFVFHGPIHHPGLFMPAVVNLCAYALITNTGWNLDTVFSAFVAGRTLFWVRLHQALAFPAFAVALSYVWHSEWGLVAGTAAASATSVAHRLVAVRGLMRYRVPLAEIRDGFRTLPGILAFGVRAAPGTVLQGIANEVGTWVLGALGSIAMVGAYNRAWTLGRRFLELNWRISEMLFPTLVQRRAKGDADGFERAFVDTLRYSAAGMLLLGAVGGGAAASIMQLFGPGFGRASTALALILVMPALATLSTLQVNAFYALDRPWLTTVLAGARAVVTVVVTIVGVETLGLTGAALGVVVGLVADVLLKVMAMRRHLAQPLSARWTPRQLLAQLAAYAGGFAAAHVTSRLFPLPANLAAGLAAGTVAYALCFVAFGGVADRDVARLRRGLERLSRRRRAPKPPVGAVPVVAAEPPAFEQVAGR